MILGHPLVAIPALLSGGALLIAGFKGSNLPVVLMALAMLFTVRSAYDRASTFRAWKHSWDSMAPEAAPRESRQAPGWLAVPALGLMAFAAFRLGGESGHEATRYVAILAGGFSLVTILWAMIRRMGRRRRRRTVSFTVTVVARPVMPVPSLDDAYRALPSHCRAILRGRQ